MWYNKITNSNGGIILMTNAKNAPNAAANRFSARDLAFMSLMSVIIAVCAWITVPAAVPFTFQTFGIFLTLCLLGGKKGLLSITVYILLGLIGLPVFSGFKGGAGVLFGATGGYIIGFLLIGITFLIITKLFGEKIVPAIAALVIGDILCFAFGTIWYITVYNQKNEAIGLMTALGWCVFPFIIPDCIKLICAVFISKKIKSLIKI